VDAQNCDIMQIFRIMCKGLYLEIFLIHRRGIKRATHLCSSGLAGSTAATRCYSGLKTLLRCACFRYALNSRAGSGLL